jgi:hypothetical protein
MARTCLTHGIEGRTYTGLVGEPEGKRSEPGRRWEVKCKVVRILN